MDSTPWWKLWENYLAEARYWNQRTRERVFGSEWRNREVTRLGPYTPAGLADLTESDRLFVGEFVRRHHPRMAHEFALHGVPGAGDPLCLPVPPDRAYLADLAGLIARSHGGNIRNTFVYLTQIHDGIRRVYETVPVYLMGVLRIADYLDLHAERAPKSLLKVKVLRSVISQREWDAHHSITDIRYEGNDDPERVEILANPRSPMVYSAVLRWVRGIQAELDHTWAVYGEVFGLDPKFRRLSVRLRRVTSPLEDENRFASDKKLQFVPQPAAFTTSSPNLIPLLAQPLYGDHPEAGIRELLQNAVDAVNELESLIARKLVPAWVEVDRRNADDLGGDIQVGLCERSSDPSMPEDVPIDWRYWVEVADRGQGMTPDVIREYFLKVGATLRKSINWLLSFGDVNSTKLVRSGRFGVGTLAAFALGDKIQVTTRHYSEPGDGTTFTAGLDDDEIELLRRRVPIGTTVRVRIDEATAERLRNAQSSWDWYCLDNPRIRRITRQGEEVKQLKCELTVSLNTTSTTGWREVFVHGISQCLWRPRREYHLHTLYCNGIKVATWHRNVDKNYFSDLPELKQPVVLVIDRDAVMPLTITRDALTAEPPYVAGVRRDMLLDHCAWLLGQSAWPPDRRQPFRAPTWELYRSMHPGDGVVESAVYVVATNGLVPTTKWHLWNARVELLTAYFTSPRSYVPSSNVSGHKFLSPDDVMANDNWPAAPVRVAVGTVRWLRGRTPRGGCYARARHFPAYDSRTARDLYCRPPVHGCSAPGSRLLETKECRDWLRLRDRSAVGVDLLPVKSRCT